MAPLSLRTNVPDLKRPLCRGDFGDESVAEALGGVDRCREPSGLESLFIGGLADIDVVLAVAEHSVDKLCELSGGREDGDGIAFAPGDPAERRTESSLGAS